MGAGAGVLCPTGREPYQFQALTLSGGKRWSCSEGCVHCLGCISLLLPWGCRQGFQCYDLRTDRASDQPHGQRQPRCQCICRGSIGASGMVCRSWSSRNLWRQGCSELGLLEDVPSLGSIRTLRIQKFLQSQLAAIGWQDKQYREGTTATAEDSSAAGASRDVLQKAPLCSYQCGNVCCMRQVLANIVA